VTPPTCLWWPEIGRTVAPDGDPRLRAHLDGCEACGRKMQQIERAAAAIRASGDHEPDGDAREQARTRLMAAIGGAAARRPAPRRLWARAAVVVAASLCGATVLAAVGTRVIDGWRASAGRPPAGTDRRGRERSTRPRAAEHPRQVDQTSGPGESPPAPPTALAPAPPAAEAPPAPRPRPPARSRPASRPAPAAPPPAPVPETPASPAERAFNQGWEALRSGDHLRGAAEMERALMLGPGGNLEEDARYWRAVALGRAGATRDARQAMETFLRHHPASPRAAEVSAMFGWLLVEAGDRAAARDLFRAAQRSSNPRVVESARAGLEQVGP
jgi:TolA-binding protein